MRVASPFERIVAGPPVGMHHAAWLNRLFHKSIRLSADASGIRFMRIRPMPGPSSWAAITIKDLRSVCRPRTPSSKPPK